MSLLRVSSSRCGRQPHCQFCRAGSTISFNWQYAKATTRPDLKRDLSAFVEPKPLRYGTMYECRSCGQPWYLCGDPEFMNFVPRERLELFQRWNERPIVLRAEHLSQLEVIGRTPPDLYGNGSQFHETPCAVTTVGSERIDMAIVSMQRHAPFEDRRNCRIATEIAEIRPSPYALPLSVRVASSQAHEIRMGFAPTVIELPSGEHVALNWTQSFFVWQGCKSNEVTVSRRYFDWRNPPPVYGGSEDIVYFVADCIKGPNP